MIGFLAKIGGMRLIAYAAGACLLFASGALWQRASYEQAHRLQVQKQYEEYRVKVDKAIADSQALNERVQKELAAEESRQSEIHDSVVQHLQSRLSEAQEKVNDLEKRGIAKREVIEVCSAADLFRLDGTTYGMLQRAADPSSPDPAPGASEEGRALTEVGASDLIEHELIIVRMYRELAKRHDSLVDWIITKQKEFSK